MLPRYILTLCVTALLSGPLKPWMAADVDECADRTARVVVMHGGSPTDALIVAEWEGRESGCDPWATSPDGNDGGILQQRGPARHGMTLYELHTQPERAMEWWLRDLDRLRAKCGSTAGALSILSVGGPCFPVAPIVRRRCLQANLGPGCEG